MHEREAILNLWRDADKAALATVVEVKGSAYRRARAHMILSADGRSAGLINGGCLDADLWARASNAGKRHRAIGGLRHDFRSRHRVRPGFGGVV